MQRIFLIIVSALLVFGHGMMLGAPTETDTNDDTVSELAHLGLDMMNKQNEEVGTREFVEVVHVTKQIVAGTKYDITVHVVNGNKIEVCRMDVYVPLPVYKKSTELLKYHCDPYAWPQQSQEVDGAVKAAVEYYNSGSNSMKRAVRLAVTHLQKEDHKGATVFTFKIKFAESICDNQYETRGKELKECPSKVGGMKYHCTYRVEHQASSTQKYSVKNQECHQAEISHNDAKAAKAENMKHLLQDMMLPQDTLPLFDQHQEKNIAKGIEEHLRRQKKNLPEDNIAPILSDVGQNVLGALKGVLQNNPQLLGKDGHDQMKYGIEKITNLLGSGGHDLKQQGLDEISKLLGGDGHDLQKHVMDAVKGLLGGDGHDLKPHGSLIGGGDHDYKTHGNTLGGDGHDLKPHGSLIGGGDHDYKTHGNTLGGDGHDLKPHGSLIGGGDHDYKTHGNILGGDGHDLKPHGSLIGGGDHDYKTHGNILGGDDHDLCHLGHFEDFVNKHGKVYATESEKKMRFNAFCHNMKIVRELNEKEQGTATYGATIFADLTHEEFREKYLSKKDWSEIPNHFGGFMKQATIPKSAPKSFDWREKGAVTPVKNQGQCGSCWAFSTTGNIEGQWKVHRNELVSLSEQELVDCDKLDDGCGGGLPSNAYMSIMKLGGLETEKAYKYEGDDEKCKFNRSEVEVKISGAVNISSNEDDMAAWLAQNGPISIGINAFAMQFYFGGISHPWKMFCNPAKLDHGVLIVGYGVEGTEPYWVVKNSWGPTWGEKGYYRVYRGSGVCGLNTMCTSAVVN